MQFKGATMEQYVLIIVNPLRLRQRGHHFANDILKCILYNKNHHIVVQILLQFVPEGPINNMPALVQMIARHWTGDKP